MGSFSGLGIGLSLIFGCVLMGIIAELYYLLWWKKRVVASSSSSSTKPAIKMEDLSFLFCWKRHASSSFNINQQVRNGEEDLEEVGSSKNLKGEEGVDLELMRMHNLCGPPRFLFSITEESKEDLESEDGRSRKGSSPAVKSPAFSHGFNPLFEAITEEQVNRLRSSPPPKLKFLKDAEDKLIRKKLMEQGERKRDSSSLKFSNQVLPLSSS